MYYVSAYLENNITDGTAKYNFVGWTKNKLAASMYNTFGRHGSMFYDDYEIFEYNLDQREFIKTVHDEWNEDISDLDENESYIDIYETLWGEYISMTNAEYEQLIQCTDIEYEMGMSYMRTLFNLVGDGIVSLIRNERIQMHIGYIMVTYMDIFRHDYDESIGITSRIDKLQAYICRIRDDALMSIY